MSDAVRPMTDADLEGILAGARTHNAEVGVSGLLVYAQQSFLQVLEGDPQAVEGAYDRARASALHRNLRATSTHVSGGRRFPQWSMGFRHAAPGDVVEALLAPLVAEGRLEHQEAAGILLARFSALSLPEQQSAGVVTAR